MNKIKKLGLLLMAVMLCLSLAACGPFEGFDDDAAIIKASGASTVGSFTLNSLTVYTLNAKKFNGVIKVKNITVTENPTFNITLSITEGRFKVVLVKDNTVYFITDKNADGTVETELAAGTYSFRIVGEDAKINFTVTW